MDFLDIDGSHGSGGGQILRLAVGLSAVTGKPARISNIRSGSLKPGLRPQHLKGIEAVARLCDAQVSGFTEGSTDIGFSPGEFCHDHLRVDIGTAGSIGLVFQSLMVPAIHTDRPLEFEVTGGTDVAWAPNVLYFSEIFCNFLKRMGIQADVDIQGYGFYPKGGGVVILTVHPGRLKRIELTERERFVRYDVLSVASESLRKARVAERQSEAAIKILGRKSESELSDYVQTDSPGSSIHVHAHFENTTLGTTVLGQRDKPAERVGKECTELLLRQVETGACLDRWMADQILPYMALAQGSSSVSVPELTKHAKTSMWLIEKFLPVEFSVKEQEKNVIIECSGC